MAHAQYERTADHSVSAWRRARYKYIPQHIVGEILSKTWIDSAIPAAVLAITACVFAVASPEFFLATNLADLSRVLGEYLFVACGETLVMIAGGIDLSVGSTFAVCNFVALGMVLALRLPVGLAMVGTVACGGAIGAFNGILIGYLRLRAFLTTLVILVIVRAVFDILTLRYSSALLQSQSASSSDLWDMLGDGGILGVPSGLVFAAGICVAFHVLLTRMRFGWRLTAVGGSRRAAFNAGVNVRRTVFLTYALSGALTALGAFFFAARLDTVGSSTGVGMELVVITGLVLGGVSLGGGRGSIAKAVLGTTAVICITNGMLRLGFARGGGPMVVGAVLVFAVVFDIRWVKNRGRLLARTYVSPTYFAMPRLISTRTSSHSPYAINNRLGEAQAIGLGAIEGPEDVVLDEADNLYAGNRHGDIVRFFAPNYDRWEVYAHIGGHPLGMAIDRDGSLVACVAGMGLYQINRDRSATRLTSQTNRSWGSIIDDSRIRMADDLDIAPDGKIYFTDPTIRYELSEWLTEALEMRCNGRLICYDPKSGTTRTVVRKLLFPNGVCVAPDGRSILVASTWGCRIHRYWIEGPKTGKFETLIEDLPGYPDNINRASDGTYWCALVGMRSPSFDLMLSMPEVRKRMIRRVAPDNWLFANTNSGCLIRFDESGRVLETLWDRSGEAHSHITSMREHKGRLFIGGLRSNRIGVIALADRECDWTGYQSYWGAPS